MSSPLCEMVEKHERFIYGNGDESRSLVSWMTRMEVTQRAHGKFIWGLYAICGTTLATVLSMMAMLAWEHWLNVPAVQSIVG